MAVATAHHSTIRAGVRTGVPIAPPTFLLGISFGVIALPTMGSVAPVAMSVLVFSGAAQFASLSMLGAGGAAGAAIIAGVLMNARWLPMGFAIGPSLRGGKLARAAQGQAIVDASFVLSSRGDGTFDRGTLLGATLIQGVGWVSGTLVGVLAGPSLPDPLDLGLDAVFPAFYLYLLVHEAHGRRSWIVAGLGGAITLALIPAVPVGLPIVAATTAALYGLRRS